MILQYTVRFMVQYGALNESWWSWINEETLGPLNALYALGTQ